MYVIVYLVGVVYVLELLKNNWRLCKSKKNKHLWLKKKFNFMWQIEIHQNLIKLLVSSRS